MTSKYSPEAEAAYETESSVMGDQDFVDGWMEGFDKGRANGYRFALAEWSRISATTITREALVKAIEAYGDRHGVSIHATDLADSLLVPGILEEKRTVQAQTLRDLAQRGEDLHTQSYTPGPGGGYHWVPTLDWIEDEAKELEA